MPRIRDLTGLPLIERHEYRIDREIESLLRAFAGAAGLDVRFDDPALNEAIGSLARRLADPEMSMAEIRQDLVKKEEPGWYPPPSGEGLTRPREPDEGGTHVRGT